MALSVVTPPAAEPISTTDAKTHLRVTQSNEDDYIDTLVKAARRQVERDTNRALIDQTLSLTLDKFPASRVIELERAPLQSVSSITYIDSYGNQQTFASSNYEVDAVSSPGRIILKSGKSYPNTWDDGNGVTITYVCGYGSAGSSVPDDIIHGMKTLISHLYANRESIVVSTGGAVFASEVPNTYKHLILPHRVYV